MTTYFRKPFTYPSMDDIKYCAPGHVFCRSRKVLVAVDGSEGASRAATVGFEIAEMTDSKLYIIHVVPTPSVRQFVLMSDADPDVVMRKYKESGRKFLEGYRKASEEYDFEVEVILEDGLPSERIVNVAKELDVDLIVIGSQGATAGRRIGMGSSTERVILSSHCTVVVAK